MKKTIVYFCSQCANEKELNQKYGRYSVLKSHAFDNVQFIGNYSNKTSLPKVYNKVITDEDVNVVLVHDDVLITDNSWVQKIEDGLKTYDVLGLAGTANVRLTEPCLWHLMSSREDHRGKVSHVTEDGKGTFVTHFGKHSRVLILDGLFLAFNAKKVFNSGARFDESNPCIAHFYDIDFSLTCNSKKLKLGTVDINAVHNSHGLRSFTDEWLTGQVWFMDKARNGKYSA